MLYASLVSGTGYKNHPFKIRGFTLLLHLTMEQSRFFPHNPEEPLSASHNPDCGSRYLDYS